MMAMPHDPSVRRRASLPPAGRSTDVVSPRSRFAASMQCHSENPPKELRHEAAVAVFGKTSDRANQFRRSSHIEANEFHKVVKVMTRDRGEQTITSAFRKREPQFVRLECAVRTSFFPHIDPPATFARFSQTIIGTGRKGVVIPSLILRHKHDDVTAVFRRQVMDIVRCPVLRQTHAETRRRFRRGARAAAAQTQWPFPGRQNTMSGRQATPRICSPATA